MTRRSRSCCSGGRATSCSGGRASSGSCTSALSAGDKLSAISCQLSVRARRAGTPGPFEGAARSTSSAGRRVLLNGPRSNDCSGYPPPFARRGVPRRRARTREGPWLAALLTASVAESVRMSFVWRTQNACRVSRVNRSFYPTWRRRVFRTLFWPCVFRTQKVLAAQIGTCAIVCRAV
jgi:hypothetical protein